VSGVVVEGEARPGFPPVTPLAVGSLVCMIVGGIWMAGYFPRSAPLGVPAASLVLGGVLLVAALVLLSRVRPFAWGVFRTVWRWALLAYLVVSGMIEFSFVHNGATGTPLVLVSAMLVVFAVDVATLIATTVARYQRS
jgi:hypothetical protein